MNIMIRKATRRDLDGMLRLSSNVYREVAANPNFYDWVLLKKPSRGSMLEGFTRLLADAKKGDAVCLVAHADGQIAGYCFIRSDVPGSEISHVGILSILVDREYRGKGVGGKLLDSAIRRSRGKFEILHLRTFSENSIAKRLFKSRGFKYFGTAPRFIKRGSRYFDREYYYLNL